MRKSLFPLVVSAGLCGAANASPNVLFVLADDMGVDASPCHSEGSSMVRMPTLEILCASGIVFDNAQAAPVCSPTRAMIMTGQYPSRTGVGSVAGRGVALSDDEVSLFDVLDENAAGYDATLIGKWHLGSNRDSTHPDRLGIDDFYGTAGGGVKDYYKWKKIEDGHTSTSTTYVTTDFTDQAMDWIDA